MTQREKETSKEVKKRALEMVLELEYAETVRRDLLLNKVQKKKMILVSISGTKQP